MYPHQKLSLSGKLLYFWNMGWEIHLLTHYAKFPVITASTQLLQIHQTSIYLLHIVLWSCFPSNSKSNSSPNWLASCKCCCGSEGMFFRCCSVTSPNTFLIAVLRVNYFCETVTSHSYKTKKWTICSCKTGFTFRDRVKAKRACSGGWTLQKYYSNIINYLCWYFFLKACQIDL